MLALKGAPWNRTEIALEREILRRLKPVEY
jgi:hypothetical protein